MNEAEIKKMKRSTFNGKSMENGGTRLAGTETAF